MFHNGISGRWTLGVVVLVPIIVYNEVSGVNTLFGALLAALFSVLAASCRTLTNSVQIPYIRTTHRMDFLWLFLSLWMDILALLAACAILARTISSCLDNMTGGMTRILILGRNSSPNEMWPDVIGVSVVFLVSGLFMLGLENTKIFAGLMLAGMLGIVGQIGIISWLKGTMENFHSHTVAGKDRHQFEIAVSCALLSFGFPKESPKRILGRLLKANKWNGILICCAIVLFFLVLTITCLTSLIKAYGGDSEDSFIAVPIFHVMEEEAFSKVVPAAACLLVLASSGSMLELFPEMYKKIVQLSTSEWRILTKQVGYENRETGSPVLAVFISGSLCAMMAFAAPLETLIYILAGSHLLSITFRASWTLYTPFRPKVMEATQESNSSLNYSRLDSHQSSQGHGTNPTSSMTISTSFRKLWNFSRSETMVSDFTVKKKGRRVLKNPVDHEEMEREWLLLGEPQSPRLDRDREVNSGAMGGSAESALNQSTILIHSEVVDTRLIGEDVEEEIAKEDEDSSSLTDIDAIVHEYKEKVRVTGSALEGNVLRVPSGSSWRLTLLLISVLLCATSLLDLGIYKQSMAYSITGALAITSITIVLYYTPKHASQKDEEYQNVVISVILLCGSLILMVSTLAQSWPALLFWFVSGLALIIRCDLWCCPCLEKSDDLVMFQEPVQFSSTHQLYLADSHPTLVIPKSLIATDLSGR